MRLSISFYLLSSGIFFFYQAFLVKGNLPVVSRTIMPERTEYLNTDNTQQKQSFHAELRKLVKFIFKVTLTESYFY